MQSLHVEMRDRWVKMQHIHVNLRDKYWYVDIQLINAEKPRH